jgi:cell division protein FtsL
MANPPLFQRIRLVYRRSSLLLKVLVLVTILASAAALLALRGLMLGYQQQRQALQSQALQLQQENAKLTEHIAELGTEDSIRRIAMEELGLMDPNGQFFNPGE